MSAMLRRMAPASTSAFVHSHLSSCLSLRLRFSSSVSYRERLRSGFGNSNVKDAVDVFDQMVRSRPLPSIVDFSKLLSAIAKMKRYGIVISLCKKMELHGISHSNYSLSILINCFCRSRQVGLGFSVLGKIMKLGYEPDVITFNTLINGLCIEGKLSAALSLVERMVKDGYTPDVVTCTTVVNGLCLQGRIHEAVTLVDQMPKKGHIPNVITYGAIVNGICKSGDSALALNLLIKMEERRVEVNVVVYNTIIDCLCKDGRVDDALNLFKKMDDRGVAPDTKSSSDIGKKETYGHAESFSKSNDNNNNVSKVSDSTTKETNPSLEAKPISKNISMRDLIVKAKQELKKCYSDASRWYLAAYSETLQTLVLVYCLGCSVYIISSVNLDHFKILSLS
ncbi:PREDICTED: pentatricopeptide repeat-containing protein At1g12300, mitochondrial-like [Tarenaya hassleriana]|uniref:pentatricopeptide repeat-containing protein At1g12300, mitochondrial-like n=1 Tax=Tarenaya hassleriana TaxID=28532 RepID=UPI0008FD0CF7|nr:PREDICTED: pentatricopeptide repeat-containing protein At1g12300, mitochondrial-like [Tarenaya hassleriana]